MFDGSGAQKRRRKSYYLQRQTHNLGIEKKKTMNCSFDNELEGGDSSGKRSDRSVSIKSQFAKVQNLTSRWVKTGRELIKGIKKKDWKLDLIDNLDYMVQKLSTRLCRPEEVFIRKQDESDYLYFLVSGKASVYINQPARGKIEDAYFEKGEGSMLGEIGVAFKSQRTAFCIAENYLILFEMSVDDFHQYVKLDRSLLRAVRNRIEQYSDKKHVIIKDMVQDTLFQERTKS